MDFRLIVPDDFTLLSGSSQVHSQRSVLTIDGRRWILVKGMNIDHEDTPNFVCISYRWGVEREDHPFYADSKMSSRTLPALAAAMELSDHQAFWIDVFCVPPESELSRQATLESMGYIYSRATQAVIVLGWETFSVLEEMISEQPISESKLEILEHDEWVTSVWTYQEVVNAQEVHFMSENEVVPIDLHVRGKAIGHSPRSIECSVFFNALGYSLMKNQQRTASDPFATIRQFSNLDILENVLADWQKADYTYRSAFAIICNISCKENDNPANYFYASLGALTHVLKELKWSQEGTKKNLAHKWMDACEGKLDFSYIYTIAQREEHPDRRWRPVADAAPGHGRTVPAILRPIFAWHSWGEMQSGNYDHHDGRLWLHHMVILEVLTGLRMSRTARDAIVLWLGLPKLPELSDRDLANTTFDIIQTMGFEGDSSPINVEHGLIYSHRKFGGGTIRKVLLSTEIRYPMGAPGLIDFIDQNREQRYESCVFIGSCSHLLVDGESVKLSP